MNKLDELFQDENLSQKVKGKKWNKLNKHFKLENNLLKDPPRQNAYQYKPNSDDILADIHSNARHNVNGYRDSRSDGVRNTAGETIQRKPQSRVLPSKAIHNIYKTHLSQMYETDSQVNLLNKKAKSEASHEELEGSPNMMPEDHIGWNIDNNPSRPPIHSSKLQGPSTYPTAQRQVSAMELNAFEDQEDDYASTWRPVNPQYVTQSKEFMMAEDNLRSFDPHSQSYNSEYMTYDPGMVDGYVDDIRKNRFQHESTHKDTI